MVAFGILIGLAALALPVAVIVLIAGMANLKRRVAALEAQLASLPRTTPLPARAAEAAHRATSEPGPAPQSGTASEPGTEAEPDTRPETASPPLWTPPPDLPLQPARPASAPVPRRPSGFDRGLAWASANWIYVVSAVSLGLAGIFLVQYGIEKGLLTPWMRVAAAMALGIALIAAGETVRRRWGDEGETSTAALPSTFSGAGIVVLYAAILAARGLYGLIGPETAFAGLLATSALALVFGWFYGPFLAAAGLTGAAAAPFLVGGEAESGTFFYLYYGLLGATAPAVDALRRWGWVSVLGLGLGYAMGTVVFAEGGAFAGFAALLLWLAFAAMALPRLEIWPSHPGWTMLESLRRAPRKGETGVIAPTRIAAASLLASTALLFFAGGDQNAAEGLLTYAALAILILAVTLWASAARGLADLALIPAAAFLGRLAGEPFAWGPLYREIALFDWSANPEAAPPLAVTLIVGLATLVTIAFAWRSFRGPYPALWAAAAAIFAPGAAVTVELFWQPGARIGHYFWAGHAIALAALMTLFAERFARADGEDRRRAAYAALSALSLIALALFILLADAALTVALSVLIAAAAALDRRFRLPEMHWFLLAGVATLGWRLILDPGLADYADQAPLREVLLAFGAALAGLGAGMALLPDGRARSRALLESALWAYGGTLASILLYRAIDRAAPGSNAESHWAMALFGLVWVALALAQVYRLQAATELRWLRRALAIGYGGLAALAFLAALTVSNPFFAFGEIVLGAQPFDTLSVAYALPALLCAAIALRAGWMPGRAAFKWLSGGFFAIWAFLEIRWFWHGALYNALGFSQPELYTYTVALLLTGGALLYQAIAGRSTGLRRLALTVIGLAIAKVFLVDAAGLAGLLRVFSFLGLGLALAGLAWFDRWAADRQAPERGAPEAE